MESRLAILTFASCAAACAQPYDFASATALLDSELAHLNQHVAVIVRQNGRDIYRYQHGDIDYGTKVHLASFTKTLSAAVVLSCVDAHQISLNEHIGDTLPFFNNSGIGAPTVTDCFGMRHGIHTPITYDLDRRFTLEQAVTRIGLYGSSAFAPGTELDYDGNGMESVGRIAEIRASQAWGDLARARIFNPCDMPSADYLEFDPNPAIAGGARSSADETIRFAQMIIDGGVYNNHVVLSPASIQRYYINATRDLPVMGNPWPDTNPLYPYGEQPDYGFGDWILAQRPDDLYVEEVVGAGAWGSFISFDRRRGITSVLITDVPAGSQMAMPSALGLYAILRQQADGHQATNLIATPTPGASSLTWHATPGATSYRIYAADSPIRSIYDLRAAALLLETSTAAATAAWHPYFAVTAVFGGFENTALTPAANTLQDAAFCASDFNRDHTTDFFDYLDFVNAFAANNQTADINADGSIDFFDYLDFVQAFSTGC